MRLKKLEILIEDIDDAIEKFDKGEIDATQAYGDFIFAIKKLVVKFRELTGKKITRNISEEVRQQRSENMRKNRFVKQKCTTQQQEES